MADAELDVYLEKIEGLRAVCDERSGAIKDSIERRFDQLFVRIAKVEERAEDLMIKLESQISLLSKASNQREGANTWSTHIITVVIAGMVALVMGYILRA